MRLHGIVFLALFFVEGGFGGFQDTKPAQFDHLHIPSFDGITNEYPVPEDEDEDDAFSMIKELLEGYQSMNYNTVNNQTTFFGGKSTRMSPLAQAYEQYYNLVSAKKPNKKENQKDDQDDDEDDDDDQNEDRRKRDVSSSESAEDSDELSLIILRNSTLPHRRQKRQSAPAPCMTPATSHCSNWVNSRFRTADGTCNNPNNLIWGAAGRAFNRLLDDSYEDGFDAPRGGFNSRLPNPRQVSVTVHPDSSVVNSQITNMVPVFGQFLDHDITRTPETASPCCSNPSSNAANCWPINVDGDAFFSQFGARCLDFTRSTPCARNNQREQSNANTAFIDGSMIYGSDVTRQNNLRTFSGGQLKTNPSFRGFPPSGQAISAQVQGDFAAGDDRINENPALAVMHTVWLMEHNRIAAGLNNAVRGAWNDELLYQVARKINSAQLQIVTYSEYLKIILGPSAYSNNNLASTTWSTYSSSTDPTILNEFATAAYRFGHSLVAGVMRLFNAQDQQADSYQLANEYFQSRKITQFSGQGYDMILRGLFRQNAPEMDRFVTTGVTQNLFRPQNQNFGSDLVARNIQRGRDHGLRPYDDYRVACGLPSIASASWASAPAGIDPTGWSQASRVYRTPADIDLFVGGLLEAPVSGGLSGPTFTCIKATQFNRLKFGDRYFYTHNLASGFSGAQLDNLIQRRMSDIICDNSQQPNAPANVFLVQSSSNPSIPCGSTSGRPQINFSLYV